MVKSLVDIEIFLKNDKSLLRGDYDFTINHVGFSGKMEVNSAKTFLVVRSRNINCDILNIMAMETRSFNEVKNVYPGIEVVKQECIGHIQKRVGSRFCSLKKTEKHLGKRGPVDSVINKLQNYFGMAVRSNVGNL